MKDSIIFKIKECLKNRSNLEIEDYDRNLFSFGRDITAETMVCVLLDLEEAYNIELTRFFDVNDPIITINKLSTKILSVIEI